MVSPKKKDLFWIIWTITTDKHTAYRPTLALPNKRQAINLRLFPERLGAKTVKNETFVVIFRKSTVAFWSSRSAPFGIFHSNCMWHIPFYKLVLVSTDTMGSRQSWAIGDTH